MILESGGPRYDVNNLSDVCGGSPKRNERSYSNPAPWSEFPDTLPPMCDSCSIAKSGTGCRPIGETSGKVERLPEVMRGGWHMGRVWRVE